MVAELERRKAKLEGQAPQPGLGGLMDLFSSIRIQQEKLGHLTFELSTTRYEAYKQMMAYAKEHMSKPDFKKFPRVP